MIVRLGAYTAITTVFLRRGVSLVVVTVCALLPLGGTVCAALCQTAAATASGHGEHRAAAAHCEGPVSGLAQVRGAPGHGCDRHNGAVREPTSALTAARADSRLVHMAQYVAPALPALLQLDSTRAHSGSSPPGTASPTRAPLALRI